MTTNKTAAKKKTAEPDSSALVAIYVKQGGTPQELDL